jgi:hypothetical protein
MDKKIHLILIIAAIVSLMVPPVLAAPKKDYNSITAGEVVYKPTHYLAGEVIPTGFDEYGYNYQGHMFKGSYFNSYAGGYNLPVWEGDDAAYYQRLVDEGYFADVATAEATATAAGSIWWAFPYREVTLVMKWNDAWISNLDRDFDGELDRNWGFPSYVGSGAWLTNHQSGEYEQDGEIIKWNYFTKIVAAPADAYTDGGIWYTADGIEIGPVIWGSFATIMTVENDPGLGTHGLQYVSPFSAGFGAYSP